MSERPAGDSGTTGGVNTTTVDEVPPTGMSPSKFLWDVPEVAAFLKAQSELPEADWVNLTSGGASMEQHPELAELRQKAEEAIHRTPGYEDENADAVLDGVVKMIGGGSYGGSKGVGS